MPQSQVRTLKDQARLVAGLARRLQAGLPSLQGERLIETHISWVILAGAFAYKIKKALSLGFLDFTALDSRRFYCEEEVRLNRRLAPQIYLDVVPIGGSVDAPEPGATPALEWAVRMARFDVDDEMDRRLRSGTLHSRHIDSLAALLARFHRELPASPDGTEYGSARYMSHVALGNLSQLGDLLTDAADRAACWQLQQAVEEECGARRDCIEKRRAGGRVRECHGDLHLANIVLMDDEAVPFDGIEFDPALRWIDLMNDLAFPYMDLIRYGRPDLAHRLLTRYLEETGDYGGVEVLPLYASGRAAVRAMVNALRAAQASGETGERRAALDACRAYLDVAARLLAPRRPALVITCGLPGSGKSTFALAAAERLGAIRIRSDVERKRLFGLNPLDASRERAGDIYAADVGARTYEALRGIARTLLAAGFGVIVDAAFLRQAERDSFRQLAESLGIPFAVASLRASDGTLRRRIKKRMRQGGDPSEADLGVLELLQGIAEPLQPGQTPVAEFVNDGEQGFSADDPGWERLERLLGVEKF